MDVAKGANLTIGDLTIEGGFVFGILSTYLGEGAVSSMREAT